MYGQFARHPHIVVAAEACSLHLGMVHRPLCRIPDNGRVAHGTVVCGFEMGGCLTECRRVISVMTAETGRSGFSVVKGRGGPRRERVVAGFAIV